VSRFEGKPFVLVGVNSDRERGQARRENQRLGINWRSWWDGDVNGPVASAWQVPGLPWTVVLDQRGVVRRRGLSGPALERAVADLLASGPSKPR
jgi:hypothetical protein